MAWTTPKTWVTGEPLTASDMNTHIRDNLDYLKDQVNDAPRDSYEVNESSDYTTTSTSFVDVDATNLSLTITTTGRDVLVGFFGSVHQGSGSQYVYFDVDVDGARNGGDDGLIFVRTEAGGNIYHQPSFVVRISGLSAGSHTFKLQWKVSASTGTLYAGAGTGSRDVHPQFWVKEL